MCSVAEEDFVPSTEQNGETNKIIDLVCKKCNIEKAMVRLQKRHSYCRNCFVTMVSHKFRSTLGKTKLMRNDEKVLCVFHGNQASIALSYLLKQGVDEKTHKRLRFRTIFLYVDESPLRAQEVSLKKVSEIFRILRECGFHCYVIKLSSAYEKFVFKNFDDQLICDYLLPNEDDKKLSSLFSQMKNNTSKIDLLWRLRYQLYFSVAKSLECQKIFTPECGTDLSVRLLSNVALGRGSQIPSDVAVCDKKLPDIFVIRPLREITSKEIAFYCVFSQLELSVVNPVLFMCEASTSLQEETESFIYRLQEEFSSTVYTIFHTGDKLKITEKANERICQLCLSSFEADESKEKCQKSNFVTSIEEIDRSVRSCSNCDCRKKSDDIRVAAKDVLCYACQHILTDVQSINDFPVAVLNEIRFQSRMNAMRKEIEDFLL